MRILSLEVVSDRGTVRFGMPPDTCWRLGRKTLAGLWVFWYHSKRYVHGF